MPDYKELYLSLFRATERAISALIEAQRAAEEAFINKHGHNDNEGNERKRFFVTSFLRMTGRLSLRMNKHALWSAPQGGFSMVVDC